MHSVFAKAELALAVPPPTTAFPRRLQLFPGNNAIAVPIRPQRVHPGLHHELIQRHKPVRVPIRPRKSFPRLRRATAVPALPCRRGVFRTRRPIGLMLGPLRRKVRGKLFPRQPGVSIGIGAVEHCTDAGINLRPRNLAIAIRVHLQKALRRRRRRPGFLRKGRDSKGKQRRNAEDR
jgi:hypothetical protein